ncbi:hypothetical protein EUTSA_v10008905mg [Eutrema salsugineum]|uniref:Uncharacterized protein n=1 Tax=Eutrema salsugineum TaxID=72664 RepID=V4MVX3_EUTSA|nr:uncharacterized protein LOC18994339 [Eutrema salsugineum]ESQ36396.1 hypothetical protein EUTSA_v10008905mg [Eutrema salsugineum]
MADGKNEGKKGCVSVVIVVCLLLIVGLDIAAGFMGLQAEAAQQDVKHTRVWLLECKAPSQTAFVLGIVALVCLISAHLIANMIGCSISNMAKAFAGVPKITGYINVACFCLTWIVGLVGAGALAMGIWSNRESRSKCGFTNKHVLSLGGKVCFLHAIVSIVFYVSNVIAKKSCCF